MGHGRAVHHVAGCWAPPKPLPAHPPCLQAASRWWCWRSEASTQGSSNLPSIVSGKHNTPAERAASRQPHVHAPPLLPPLPPLFSSFQPPIAPTNAARQPPQLYSSYVSPSPHQIPLPRPSCPLLLPSPLPLLLPCCSQVFPDYKERVVRHEAAHFLTGYLLGVPVANYSLTLGKEHTDFAEAKLQASARVWEGGWRQLAAPLRHRMPSLCSSPPAACSARSASPAHFASNVPIPLLPCLPFPALRCAVLLQKRLIEGVLESAQVDQLSIIAMAGEGRQLRQQLRQQLRLVDAHLAHARHAQLGSSAAVGPAAVSSLGSAVLTPWLTAPPAALLLCRCHERGHEVRRGHRPERRHVRPAGAQGREGVPWVAA